MNPDFGRWNLFMHWNQFWSIMSQNKHMAHISVYSSGWKRRDFLFLWLRGFESNSRWCCIFEVQRPKREKNLPLSFHIGCQTRKMFLNAAEHNASLLVTCLQLPMLLFKALTVIQWAIWLPLRTICGATGRHAGQCCGLMEGKSLVEEYFCFSCWHSSFHHHVRFLGHVVKKYSHA